MGSTGVTSSTSGLKGGGAVPEVLSAQAAIVAPKRMSAPMETQRIERHAKKGSLDRCFIFVLALFPSDGWL